MRGGDPQEDDGLLNAKDGVVSTSYADHRAALLRGALAADAVVGQGLARLDGEGMGESKGDQGQGDVRPTSLLGLLGIMLQPPAMLEFAERRVLDQTAPVREGKNVQRRGDRPAGESDRQLLLALPLHVLIARRRPEDLGLWPDGQPCDDDPPSPAATTLPLPRGASMADALRQRVFWMLTIAAGLEQLAAMIVWVHQIPFIVSAGIDPIAAAGVAGPLSAGPAERSRRTPAIVDRGARRPRLRDGGVRPRVLARLALRLRPHLRTRLRRAVATPSVGDGRALRAPFVRSDHGGARADRLGALGAGAAPHRLAVRPAGQLPGHILARGGRVRGRVHHSAADTPAKAPRQRTCIVTL